jgi:hypothetical protein
MVPTTLGLVAALAVAACSILEPMPITVESEEFPDVRIACAEEAGLSPNRCRA